MVRITDNWNSAISESRNQLVFAERNRDYGAYQLRSGYTGRMILAMGITFVLFVSAALVPKVTSTVDVRKKYTIQTLDLQEPIPEKQETQVRVASVRREESSPKASTTRFVVPVIDAASSTVDPPPIQSQIEGGISSKENSSVGDSVGVVGPEDLDGDVVIVDVLAMPRGGIEKFYDYVSQNFRYPTRCKEEGIWGYVLLRFKVDVSGYISEVSALETTSDCPEFTAEAVRVLKLSPRWIPAQSGGRPIEAWRILPISLQVESEDEFF